MAPWQLLLLVLLDSTLSVMEDKDSEGGEDKEEGEDTCLSSPCGLRARCKNLEGEGRFLCTCDPMSQFYHGNPYTACVICTTDAHCQAICSFSISNIVLGVINLIVFILAFFSIFEQVVLEFLYGAIVSVQCTD